MPDPRLILKADPEPCLYRGVITAAPTTPAGPVTALVPSLSPDFATSPLLWPPRLDGVTPREGDECLIAVDDQGGEWLIAWTPAHA